MKEFYFLFIDFFFLKRYPPTFCSAVLRKTKCLTKFGGVPKIGRYFLTRPDIFVVVVIVVVGTTGGDTTAIFDRDVQTSERL